MKAHALFRLDTDYVVNDGEVIIVDEFTGRLMPGRRYSDGLHQAIEAKENVEVRRESRTLATISFQNYFRLFKKLAGMTGTAMTEAEEFARIYRLDTLVIPTNKLLVRADNPDAVYKNHRGKFMAAVAKVKELNKKEPNPKAVYYHLLKLKESGFIDRKKGKHYFNDEGKSLSETFTQLYQKKFLESFRNIEEALKKLEKGY